MSREIFFALVAALLLAPAAARAQTGDAPDVDAHRVEAGAFYTGVNLEGFGETINGLGGGFGYRF